MSTLSQLTMLVMSSHVLHTRYAATSPTTSLNRPLTLSLQSQVVNIVDFYKICAVKAMLTFQEDDGGVRGEVVARLRDVVGEVAAYLV